MAGVRLGSFKLLVLPLRNSPSCLAAQMMPLSRSSYSTIPSRASARPAAAPAHLLLGRPCLYEDASQLIRIWISPSPALQQTTRFISTTLSRNGSFRTRGPAKILSIGGCDFSTNNNWNTYTILRQGVTATNRLRFARNTADFAKANTLDGVDIYWEDPAVS
jgi:hypothetical protein